MNTYYKKTKKDYKNQYQIVTISKVEKKKQNNITVITKKDCKNKDEINIENYLINKKIENGEYRRHRYRNIPERDKENVREYQKNYCKTMKILLQKHSFFVYHMKDR